MGFYLEVSVMNHFTIDATTPCRWIGMLLIILLIAQWSYAEKKKSDKKEGFVSDYEIDRARRYGDLATLQGLLQKLADQRNPKAEYELGLLYYQGRSGKSVPPYVIEKDYARAVTWLTRAADHGHVDAMGTLAEIYEKGRGVPLNDSKAVDLYLKAAQYGNVLAQNTMGVRYASGRGVPLDTRQSVKWFEKAAEQGYKRAQMNLAIMYRNGEGVERNLIIALKWLVIAKDRWWPGVDESDMQQAAFLASELKRSMTPEQIKKAERLQSEWAPKSQR
ncbi:MAG: tetratricopeptide repeat protein [Syntrophaceae bacterium]|nr:tetratricopeptide repeat protein [Syntrophaceae bacterium]